VCVVCLLCVRCVFVFFCVFIVLCVFVMCVCVYVCAYDCVLYVCMMRASVMRMCMFGCVCA